MFEISLQTSACSQHPAAFAQLKVVDSRYGKILKQATTAAQFQSTGVYMVQSELVL
jgi:hypothetical protein